MEVLVWLALAQTVMTSVFFGLSYLQFGSLTDYEDLCARTGASVLWFFTLPLSLVTWWNNRKWELAKKSEQETRQGGQ